jgi:hypothetical protein
LGREVDRQQFATALLRHLDASYRQQFLGRGTLVKGGDLGSEIAQAPLSRPAPAATTSPAPTTTRGTRAEKSRKA